jgi:hypothetical protein
MFGGLFGGKDKKEVGGGTSHVAVAVAATTVLLEPSRPL